MREDIFFKIRKFSLRYDYFLFFDTADYWADQFFIQKQVRVWFEDEYAKPGTSFIGIFCRVRKRDRARFMEALELLKDKMLLCGYPDYESEVKSFIRRMKKVSK